MAPRNSSDNPGKPTSSKQSDGRSVKTPSDSGDAAEFKEQHAPKNFAHPGQTAMAAEAEGIGRGTSWSADPAPLPSLSMENEQRGLVGNPTPECAQQEKAALLRQTAEEERLAQKSKKRGRCGQTH